MLSTHQGSLVVAGVGGTIERTTDAGATWELCASIVDQAIVSMGSYPQSDLLLAGGSAGALLVSRDDGVQWAALESPTQAAVTGITCVADNSILASTYDGHVFRSEDRGVHWTDRVLTTDVLGKPFLLDNGGVLVGGAALNLFHSPDNGITWDTLAFPGVVRPIASTSQGLLAAGSSADWYTCQDGVTWVKHPGQAFRDQVLVRTFAFADPDRGIRIGGPGFIECTSDGGNSWDVVAYSQVHSGSTLAHPLLNGITSLNDSIALAFGNDAIVLRTTDHGLTWITNNLEPPTPFSPNLEAMAFADRENGAAVSEFGGYYQTSDGGSSWYRTESPLESGSVYSIVSLPSGRLLSTLDSTLYSSTDAGVHWNPLATWQGRASRLEFPHSDTGYTTVFSGTWPAQTSKIVRTLDGGTSWHPTQTDSLPAQYWTFRFKNGHEGWAVCDSGKIFHTTDAGDSWRALHTGFNVQLTDLLWVDDSLGFAAGGHNTILRTTDAGKIWSKDSLRILAQNLTDITITGLTRVGNVVLAAGSDNLYRLDLTPEPSHSTVHASQGETSDVMVYPNPARDKVNFVGSDVIRVVTIYDAVGHVVMQSASPTLDVSQLPIGSYHATVTMGGRMVTARVVILR